MSYPEAYRNLCEKFTSGNSHPVERSTITREEWEAIQKVLQEANLIPRD